MPYDYGQAQQRIQNLSGLREAIAKQQPTHYGAGGLNLLAQIIASQGQKKAREEARQAQQGFYSGVMSDVQGAPAQGVHDLQGPMPTGEAIQGQAYEVAPVAPKGLAEALMARGAEFGMPEMSQAGLMQALTTQGKIAEAQAKPSKPFGSGMEGMAWAILNDPNLDPNSREAQTAYAIVSQPRSTIDPESGREVKTYPVIPQFLQGKFGGDSGLTVSDKPVVEVKYGEGEKEAATFFDRMMQSEGVIGEVMGEGFDPTTLESSLWNAFDDKISLDIISRSGMSEQQKRYLNTVQNFITAQLRQESGAAIGKDEYLKAYETYFPRFGDTAKAVQDKKEARQIAISGMYRSGERPLSAEGKTMPDFNKAASPQQDDVQSAIDEARAAGATDEEIKAITGEL